MTTLYSSEYLGNFNSTKGQRKEKGIFIKLDES